MLLCLGILCYYPHELDEPANNSSSSSSSIRPHDPTRPGPAATHTPAFSFPNPNGQTPAARVVVSLISLAQPPQPDRSEVSCDDDAEDEPRRGKKHDAAWGPAGGGARHRRRGGPVRAPGAAARRLHRQGGLQRLRAPPLRHRRPAARRGRRTRHAHLLHAGDGGSGRAEPQRSLPQGVLALAGH